MFVAKKMHLNKFEDASIPSARKLFERYGFTQMSGHPDNTDPNKFGVPSNSGLTPVDGLRAASQTGRRLLNGSPDIAEPSEPSSPSSPSGEESKPEE